MIEACGQCGVEIEGGGGGCRALFEQLIARDFSNSLYFRTHRLLVDIYCLQHPEDFCRSAKSLAAHLVGLCSIVEGGASPSLGAECLRKWLDGNRALDKPDLPISRGIITVGQLDLTASPTQWADDLEKWALSVWDAYHDLQPLARGWLDAAGRRR